MSHGVAGRYLSLALRCLVAVAVLTAALLPAPASGASLPEPAAPAPVEQSACFPETGFCIERPAFLEYFRALGGTRILGYPVSREFTLDGFPVQFFQRVVLQLNAGRVERLNVLDSSVMPMTRANQSTFPGPDPGMAAAAPVPGTSNYGERVGEFIRTYVPDTWPSSGGQPVGFFELFRTTVPTDDPNLALLANLEIWGLPTSRPAFDPNNAGFIYQRFQRGIMHFRTACVCTEGILVGDYFKAVITGQNLPPDLEADMSGSRYFRQYSPGAPNW
ncbi:MAG: hypothetical protein ACRDI2_24400, partial [Chloroflexota bacterium]